MSRRSAGMQQRLVTSALDRHECGMESGVAIGAEQEGEGFVLDGGVEGLISGGLDAQTPLALLLVCGISDVWTAPQTFSPRHWMAKSV